MEKLICECGHSPVKHWEKGCNVEECSCKRFLLILEKEPKPLFTTKHYKAIAEFLKNIAIDMEISGVTTQRMIQHLIVVLEKDNPKFKVKEFKKLIWE